MTTTEREDFKELRAEMRESFAAVLGELKGLNERVVSLETSRSVEAALAGDRRRAGERQWAKTVAVASICSGVVIACVQLINFLLGSIVHA